MKNLKQSLLKSLLLTGATLFSDYALTQQSTLPQKRPVEEPLKAPPFTEEKAEPLQLPDYLKPAPDTEALSGLPIVFVKRFELTGNRVFDSARLAEVAEPYKNRSITPGELQELRYKLTLFYVNQGYINSGAVIPDQDVKDGVIEIQIIEGELNEIRITGDPHLSKSYIKKRIALGAGPPLNVIKLGDRLQILQQNPRIKQLNARLVPGVKPGESILDVDIEEKPSSQIWLEGNNHQPPSVGGNQFHLRAFNQNLTSHGDTLSGEYGKAEGSSDWSIDYRLPLTARDTEFGINYHSIDSKVIEKPFDVLNIESDETSFGISLTHPFYKTLHETFSMGISLDRRSSTNYLAGQRFDWTPASENGQTKLTVVRFSQEWVNRQRTQVFAARSLISGGLDKADATVNGNEQDGEFASWLGQVQWIRRLGSSNTQLLFGADVQWSRNSLPSMEQFTIGGFNSVRGYRENRLVADRGFTTSFEFRFPVLNDRSSSFGLQLATFATYGEIENNVLPDPTEDHITSIGVGLLGSMSQRIKFDLYYGYAFQDFNDANKSTQDKGIHFNLSVRLL